MTNLSRLCRVKQYTFLVRLFAVAGFAQAILQFVNLLIGLLVVRLLSPKEYAYYTIVGGVMGFLSVISDSGMNSAAFTVGGRIWQSPADLGRLVFTFNTLRRRFAALALLVSIPILCWLLAKNGAGQWVIFSLCAVSAAQFWIALPAIAYGLAPALHQRVFETQRITLTQAMIRLAGTISGLFVWASSVAVLAAALPAQWLANRWLRKLNDSLIVSGSLDMGYRSELLKCIIKVFPGSLYYAFSGQLTIFLISIYGSTDTLANVGALGRLSQVLVVFASVCSLVIVPRFARLENNSKKILQIFCSVLVALSVICGLFCVVVSLFPGPLLTILGSHYSGLNVEVLLQFLSASLSLISGVAYQLGAARGIIYPPYLAIPTAICYQILGVIIFDFTQASQVLCFAIGLSVIQIIQTIGFFLGTMFFKFKVK